MRRVVNLWSVCRLLHRVDGGRVGAVKQFTVRQRSQLMP